MNQYSRNSMCKTVAQKAIVIGLIVTLCLFTAPNLLKAHAATSGALSSPFAGGTITFLDSTNYSFNDGTATSTGTYDASTTLTSTGNLFIDLTNSSPAVIKSINANGYSVSVSGTGELLVDSSSDATINDSIKCNTLNVLGGTVVADNSDLAVSAAAVNASTGIVVNGGNLLGISDAIAIQTNQNITVSNGILEGITDGAKAAVRSMGGTISANAGGTIIGCSDGNYGVVSYSAGGITANVGGAIYGYGSSSNAGAARRSRANRQHFSCWRIYCRLGIRHRC